MAPTPVLLAPASTLSADQQHWHRIWQEGQRHTDSLGRCVFGHTDVGNANLTERVEFFSTEYAAGHCTSSGRCELQERHFVCACVSAAKVRESLAIARHHAWHHPHLAGQVLIGFALMWVACRCGCGCGAQGARWRQLISPAPVLALAAGTALVVLSGESARRIPQTVSYWSGCGAGAPLEAVARQQAPTPLTMVGLALVVLLILLALAVAVPLVAMPRRWTCGTREAEDPAKSASQNARARDLPMI